jgi:hypothetical protein
VFMIHVLGVQVWLGCLRGQVCNGFYSVFHKLIGQLSSN